MINGSLFSFIFMFFYFSTNHRQNDERRNVQTWHMQYVGSVCRAVIQILPWFRDKWTHTRSTHNLYAVNLKRDKHFSTQNWHWITQWHRPLNITANHTALFVCVFQSNDRTFHITWHTHAQRTRSIFILQFHNMFVPIVVAVVVAPAAAKTTTRITQWPSSVRVCVLPRHFNEFDSMEIRSECAAIDSVGISIDTTSYNRYLEHLSRFTWFTIYDSIFYFRNFFCFSFACIHRHTLALSRLPPHH